MHHNNETKDIAKRAPVEAGVIIKLGLDVPAQQVTVGRQIGELTAQRFSAEQLVDVGEEADHGRGEGIQLLRSGNAGLRAAPAT